MVGRRRAKPSKHLGQTARGAGEDLVALLRTEVDEDAGGAERVGGLVAALRVEFAAARQNLERYRSIGHRHAILVHHAEERAAIRNRWGRR